MKIGSWREPKTCTAQISIWNIRRYVSSLSWSANRKRKMRENAPGWGKKEN